MKTSTLTDILAREVAGNDLPTWAIALIIAAAILALLTLARTGLRKLVRRMARRSDNPFDDELAGLVQQTSWVFMGSIAVFAGAQVLTLPERAEVILETAVVLAVLYQLGRWAAGLVIWGVDRIGRQDEAEPLIVDTQAAASRAPAVLRLIAQTVVWSIVLVVALQNIGIDVTALVAGLGVGGIAVALAVQNILGDLFASLSIVLDKPFEVGHFIAVGDKIGTVERVGLKTTRIRALSGEQIIFSNSDLLASRVHNYRRMVERRVVQRFRLAYDTDPVRLRQAVTLVRETVEGAERIRFDRAHLDVFGLDGYEIELVYYVLAPEYDVHMDIKQEILLQLVERLAAIGVRFAVPVRRMVSGDELSALGPRGNQVTSAP